MDEWKKVLISPHTKIHEVIKIIDINSSQIALVINKSNKLLGTVTDGDIRRGILKGIPLEETVEQIMNRNPVTVPEIKDKRSVLNILKMNKLRHLPVVDESGCVIGIERLDDLVDSSKNENWVVIMAGGLGNRLRPLTDNCPKPMLTIGDKPVLEIILRHLINQGFYRFCFSINYKAEQIIAHFGDGSRWGAEIQYIHEENAMGTAGSLSLFDIKTDKPVIVMNGDILTKLSFEQLLSFHQEHLSKVTVAVTTYDFQVPYGVVKVNKDRLVGFEEKPVYTNFINAGIYVFNPEVLKMIPGNSYYGINNLLEKMLGNNEKISIFPIREYWMDIGDIGDFNQATQDFEEVFR
ncbi:MAG TPA: nucleotidyltransferase family protein [Ruminiclostridium sp.]|nr:nucleotidyltransferase family protein [Ruminiclostridium sp.]